MLRNILLITVLVFLYVLTVYAEKGRKVVINLPSSCYRVKRTDCKKQICRIYAEKISGECLDVETPVAVDVTGDAVKAELYLDGKYSGSQNLHEFNLDSVSGLFDRAERSLKRAENLQTCSDSEAVDKAIALKDYFYSDEYQKRLAKEKERIKKDVLPRLKGYKEYERAYRRNQNRILKNGEKIYVFISSSIPDHVVRRYIGDIDRIGDPNIKIVMRGFVGGIRYIKPTMQYISRLLKKDEDCNPRRDKCEMYNAYVNIDPLLFRRYEIERVPAFVYVSGVKKIGPIRSEGSDKGYKISGRVYKVYGDASLEYILSYINRGAKSKSLDQLIDRLREGFYH